MPPLCICESNSLVITINNKQKRSLINVRYNSISFHKCFKNLLMTYALQTPGILSLFFSATMLVYLLGAGNFFSYSMMSSVNVFLCLPRNFPLLPLKFSFQSVQPQLGPGTHFLAYAAEWAKFFLASLFEPMVSIMQLWSTLGG